MRWKYLIGSFILLWLGYEILHIPPATGAPANYILPDGFKGVFVLKLDSNHGITPQEVNSMIQIKVPQNGIVLVHSCDFLERFHQTFCAYESGIPIPNGHLPTTKVDDIALYELGSVSFDGNPPADYFLVGLRSEFDTWLKTRELEQRPDAPKNKTKK